MGMMGGRVFARAIARFVGGRLNAALASLPMILVLAALTQVLEGFQFYRTFDDGMLGVVAALRPPAKLDGPHPSLVTVMVSRDMFIAELGRTLPIDKSRLKNILMAVADKGPRLVAIDVDAIPYGHPASPNAVLALPMFAAVAHMLERGVSVVLVSYPRHTGSERAEARVWRERFCEAADGLKAEEGQSKGTLYWASAWLQSEGRAMSVLRYYGPGRTPEVVEGEEGLLPLGLVVSAVGASRAQPALQPTLEMPTNHCANGGVADSLPHQVWNPTPDARPESFVNYFSNLPRLIEVDSLASFEKSEPEIAGKSVILGVSSFEGVDEHMTPLGRLPGAVMHTLVAASEPVPLSENHLLAFLLDMLVGYLFVALFLALKSGQEKMAASWHEASSLIRFARAVTPLVPLVALVFLVVACAPRLAANGLWMNPLPIALGLLVHLYAELTAHHDAHGHAAHDSRLSIGKVFRQRFGRFTETARRWRGVRGLSSVLLWDLCFRTLGQLMVLTTLGLGLFMLFHPLFTGH